MCVDLHSKEFLTHCCELAIRQRVNCITHQWFLSWAWSQVAKLPFLHYDHCWLGQVRKKPQSALLKHILFLKILHLVRAEVVLPVGEDSSAPQRQLLWHNFQEHSLSSKPRFWTNPTLSFRCSSLCASYQMFFMLVTLKMRWIQTMNQKKISPQ